MYMVKTDYHPKREIATKTAIKNFPRIMKRLEDEAEFITEPGPRYFLKIEGHKINLLDYPQLREFLHGNVYVNRYDGNINLIVAWVMYHGIEKCKQ